MPYSERFFIAFKSRELNLCRVSILEKDYAGASFALQGGPNPFILDYKSGDEDPTIGIRGSSAKIEFYNNGGVPITTFASNNDDQFKVELYVDSVLKWAGFVVQDDCNEPFVRPARYVVSISATDNLALLKDVDFSGLDNTVVYTRYTLLEYIRIILNKTGLELPINIYCNVFENAMQDRTVNTAYEPFSQVKVDSRSFIKDQQSNEDCYTILSKIMEAWGCTIFQTEGAWYIMRWFEAKDFGNIIPGTAYLDNSGNAYAISLNSLITSGLGQQVFPLNANHTRSIVRAAKDVALTFNYEQPYKLLLNDDLQNTGALYRTYTQGDNTVKEYEFLQWGDGTNAPFAERFIRVITNQLGIEIDRYAVVKGLTGDNARSVASSPIEASSKDRITWSFQYKTSDSQPGNVNNTFAVRIISGATTYYLDEDGTWKTTIGAVYNVPAGDNTNVWHSVTFESKGIPADGTMVIFLNQADISTPVNETHYKDLRLTYSYYVNDSTLIVGHIHKSANAASTSKKKIDKTIYIDDAPKNSMKGVMFLSDGTTKTSTWHRGRNQPATIDFQIFSNNYINFTGFEQYYSRFNVGDSISITGTTSNNGTYTIDLKSAIIGGSWAIHLTGGTLVDETVTGGTFEFLTLEQKQFGYIQKVDRMLMNDETRLRFEGDFYGLTNVSMLSIIELTMIPGVYFIMGQMSFNYMKCEWSGTLEELWRKGEIFNESAYTNTFTYKYKNQ